MDDLISRQAAIDAIMGQPPEPHYPSWYAAQIEILPSEQPKTHWIPCSERLPERADNVIICYKAGDYTLVSTGRYLYKFKMWYVDVVGDLRDGVTAWMPLPEPYRGGEK